VLPTAAEQAQQQIFQIVQSLLRSGMTIEQVAQVTSAPIAQVTAIQKSLAL
jgi:hypothetical protein